MPWAFKTLIRAVVAHNLAGESGAVTTFRRHSSASGG